MLNVRICFIFIFDVFYAQISLCQLIYPPEMYRIFFFSFTQKNGLLDNGASAIDCHFKYE